jgi:hypothetical protein
LIKNDVDAFDYVNTLKNDYHNIKKELFLKEGTKQIFACSSSSSVQSSSSNYNEDIQDNSFPFHDEREKS